MSEIYDAVIVGGGPAGATTALYAERLGLKVCLIDKKEFPRDKICGDAISGKSVIYLKELDLIDTLLELPQVEVGSVLFSSPKEKSARINFAPGHYDGKLNGYVCRREVYDNMLFQAAKDKVQTHEGFSVTDLIKPNGQVQGVVGTTEDGAEKEIRARVVVGADGFSSVVLRKTGLYDHDPDHILVATRAYYRGITGLRDSIELHYINAVLPGYFWIFPLEDDLANVGLGMVHSSLKERDIKLKKAHVEATQAEFFRDRFKDAELIGDINGWNLPVGSKRRTVHGNGFLLVGDAAGLIDPFTGEGIGNAMCSGKIAAENILAARSKNDFSEQFLEQYSEELWKELGPELSMAYRLQKTARITPLVNLVLAKASRSRDVADWISGMMCGTISKGQLLNPLTYLKLLFS